MFGTAGWVETGVGVRGAMGAGIGCIDRDLRKSSKAIRHDFSERPKTHSAIEIKNWGGRRSNVPIRRLGRRSHLEVEEFHPTAPEYYVV